MCATGQRQKKEKSHAGWIGAPELDLFPDEASRRQAIKEIDQQVNRSWQTWLWAIFLGVVVFSLFRPLVWLIQSVATVSPDTAGWIALAILISTMVIYSIWAVRDSYPKEIRSKLLAAGIPVCIKCGYDLRGVPTETVQCPECGRSLGGRVGAVLRRGPFQGMSQEDQQSGSSFRDHPN